MPLSYIFMSDVLGLKIKNIDLTKIIINIYKNNVILSCIIKCILIMYYSIHKKLAVIGEIVQRSQWNKF